MPKKTGSFTSWGWLAAFALILAACTSAEPRLDPNQKLDVAMILKQVNDAIESSIDPNDKNFPPVSSVTLDLQVTVGTSVAVSGKPPFPLVAAVVSSEKDNVHRINLSFVPSTDRQPASATSVIHAPQSPLAEAIRAVYASVSKVDGAYKFQHGSITLQCILRTDAGLGLSFLGLVPLQFDAKHSNDLVQSLTLNFGNDSRAQNQSGSADSGSGRAPRL